MGKNNVVANPESRLAACQQRQITLGLPAPLNERLDRLVELADDEGARTNRKELVSALLLAATENGSELAETVRRFRRARAQDAAVSGDLASVLEFREHRPGPRPRRDGIGG